MIKRLFKILAASFVCISAILLTIELLYRYQIVDTYRGELYRFNEASAFSDSSGKKTIMFMGDSMTAGETSYPSVVRRLKPGYRVINAAVSGTGAIQAEFLARRRFNQFEPSIFVYQVYLGNDLFDVQYPINLETISFVRNAYWFIAQNLRSIGYLNYKAGQVSFSLRNRLAKMDAGAVAKVESSSDAGPNGDGGFSVERYFFRDRVYYKAEPGLLENTIMVRPHREQAYRTFLIKLTELLSHCRPDECKPYVLIIPHSSQINRRYLERAEALGAVFSNPEEILREEYPFIVGVRDFLASQDMDYVTVLNPIRMLRQKEAAGQQMYRTNDPHLADPTGFLAIAEYVVEETGMTD